MNGYVAIIERDEQDGFSAWSPDLSGCVAAAREFDEGVSLHARRHQPASGREARGRRGDPETHSGCCAHHHRSLTAAGSTGSRSVTRWFFLQLPPMGSGSKILSSFGLVPRLAVSRSYSGGGGGGG